MGFCHKAGPPTNERLKFLTGPMFLALPKYAMVGTRAAIYIPIDVAKAIMYAQQGVILLPKVPEDIEWALQRVESRALSVFHALSNGSLPAKEDVYPIMGPYEQYVGKEASCYYGLRLGLVGVLGCVLAKVWLRHASPQLFAVLQERVTYWLTVLMGILLIANISLGAVFTGAVVFVKENIAKLKR